MSLIEKNLVKLEGPLKKMSDTEFGSKCEKLIFRSTQKWFNSRNQPYAGGKTDGQTIRRFPVPPDRMRWETEFEEYVPVFFESEKLIDGTLRVEKSEPKTPEPKRYLQFICDVNSLILIQHNCKSYRAYRNLRKWRSSKAWAEQN